MSGLRVVVSGCGAVLDRCYGPLLRRREREGRLTVVGVHDPSPERMAQAIRAHAPSALACPTVSDLLARPADLLVVASPPAHHAAQAVAALEAGRAVLCEKPLAPTSTEAEAMVAAAGRTGRLLALALVRRWHPSSGLVRWAIRSGTFGAVRRVEGFEGGPFAWPVAGPAYFRREVSGGGVLADLGPHLLDLLADWLGDLALGSFEDDAMGGVEANARLRLHAGGVPVDLRLSRDWARPNGITVVMERATLRWTPDDLGAVGLTTEDGRRMRLAAPQPAGEFLDSFGAMLDAVLDRVSGAPGPVVEGREALATVRLIEAAYAARRRMAMPWLEAADVS